MMQTNKLQIMDDMMRNLKRGDGISNLRALQQMRQMRQPQPQTMSYMAQGGVPHLNSNRMIPQIVMQKKYGGLASLPVQHMIFGGLTRKIKQGAQRLGGAASDAFKGWWRRRD